MMELLTTIAAVPVLARAFYYVRAIRRRCFGHNVRFGMFVLGYALLGAMTASAVIDALAGRGTLDQLGFVTASGLLIIGERRRHRRNCDAAHCPKSGRRKLERSTA